MARRSYRAVVRKQNLEKNLLKKDVVKIANSSEKRVGNVYRGRTKYIDSENKLERNYVVLKDSSKGIAVAKLKSIKKFDSNGKNADKALQEINHSSYGLPKRTGVDFQKFSKNRMTKKPLKLEDKKVFPEKSARFKLSSHDLSRVLRHTKIKK